jgi:hypothetical protein
MDYIALIKRAFWITLKFRALWLFGFFLALCSATSGGGSSSGGSSSSSSSYPGEGSGDIPFDMVPVPEEIWLMIGGMIGGIIMAFCCLILLVIVIGTIVRAVTRTALIGMVDQAEETEAVTIKDGWRFGWSKEAWTTFVINMLITIPLVIIFGALLLVVALPILLVFFENVPLMILGIVFSVGLMLLWILAIIAVTIIVRPFQKLGWRYAVLHQMGAIESLKAGYLLIRQNLQDIAVVVVLQIGLGMAWVMGGIVLMLIVGLLALFIGAIPALIAFFITQAWWVALIVGMVVFSILFIIPMIFVKGLYLIFRSAIWTLTFRELTFATPHSLEFDLTDNAPPDDVE